MLPPSDFGPLEATGPSNGHWSTFLRALEYLLMPIRNFSDGHQNSVRWASEFRREVRVAGTVPDGKGWPFPIARRRVIMVYFEERKAEGI